jgi:predicted small metal-binding protein
MVPLKWICGECGFEIDADQVDEMIAKISFHEQNNYHQQD